PRQPQAYAPDLGAILRLAHLSRLDAAPRRHRRVDESRRERDRADAVVLELDVQRPRETEDGSLRRAVRAEPGCRAGAGDRLEVDDPAAGLAQERDALARDHEQPAQVDADLQVEVLCLVMRDLAADPDPRL